MGSELQFKEVSRVIQNFSLKWNHEIDTKIKRIFHIHSWINLTVRDIHYSVEENTEVVVKDYVIKNKPDCVEILSNTSDRIYTLRELQNSLNEWCEANPSILDEKLRIKFDGVICENFHFSFSDGVISIA